MNRILLTLLAPALAACASTGDYPGATPAAVAPIAMPAEPFIVTAPGPAGPATPFYVVPTPIGATVTPGVLAPIHPVTLNTR